MLETGITNTKTLEVTDENTAKTVGSGTLDVFATPMMIALIEGCCAESVESELDDESTSVGTHLDISHLAPSPVGMKITCVSRLENIEKRTLNFSVEVSDNKGLIGKGTHERVIINKERFMQKANSKLQ